MKRFAAVLCLCALCLPGCAPKQEPLPPEEFFEPEIYEPAPMPDVQIVTVEQKADPAQLQALDAPPNLKITCADEEYEAAGCGFTWVTEHGVLCADAPHPRQMREHLTPLETPETTAVLRFEYAPDEKTVRAWDEDCTPECDCASVEVPITGGVIELLPGGHIYEVVARWGDGETSGGTALYAFYINKLYPGNE